MSSDVFDPGVHPQDNSVKHATACHSIRPCANILDPAGRPWPVNGSGGQSIPPPQTSFSSSRLPLLTFLGFLGFSVDAAAKSNCRPAGRCSTVSEAGVSMHIISSRPIIPFVNHSHSAQSSACIPPTYFELLHAQKRFLYASLNLHLSSWYPLISPLECRARDHLL